jgi:hypothetical protein
MADLIAIVMLGLQYFLVVLVVNSWLGTALTFSIIAITLLILTSIGLLLWHRKKLSQTAMQWVTLAVRSVVLGIAFFGVDFLIALSHGQANPFRYPGGLLGLPLTFLICPGGTIISLAGVARAFYMSRHVDGAE